MTKIRTIIRTNKRQDTIQTETFPSTLTFDELLSHINTLVRWKNFQITFDNVTTDQLMTVDSDEVLQQCYAASGDVISFTVMMSKQRGMFPEEVALLVQEGYPKGQSHGLLRKFNGDVSAARRELEVRRKVTELAKEGFQRGKCRKLLNANGGDVEVTRRILNDDPEDKVKILVEEGIPRKVAVRLMKRYNGDLNQVREEYFSPKEVDEDQYQDTADELVSQGFKPKRRVMRLLVKYHGDAEKVKEEISNKKRSSHWDSEKKRNKKKRNGETLETESVEEHDLPFSEVRTIYLDGNNMLYIEKEMRDYAISGRNRVHAERMLANLVLSYCQTSTDEINFKLMFDATSFHGYTDTHFEIICARKMGFSIADDALVHISEVNPDIRDTTLFVTSDKELIERLKSLGSFVMKPKDFLRKTKEIIGESEYEAILRQQVNLIEDK